MDRESFSAACAFVIRFGKHSGKTIARIGSNDEGLKYLDWLVGMPWLREPAASAIKTFLSHPSNARQLDQAIEE